MMPLVFGINSDEGCELKHVGLGVKVLRGLQPPSSGCELKPRAGCPGNQGNRQLPSSGCELKPVASWRAADDGTRSRLRAAVS